ncbi:hypothetical protein [Kitasatospora sp. LaBMicrA B282]|uniref:hypothetical protein n=1 Tax=Kitasatospora sp. LaBMicrA B282 TaxID=3420949 RepID=UPI003D11534A
MRIPALLAAALLLPLPLAPAAAAAALPRVHGTGHGPAVRVAAAPAAGHPDAPAATPCSGSRTRRAHRAAESLSR